MGTELVRRLVVGGTSLAILVVMVILAPYPWFRPVFGLGVAAVASVALWEYYSLARKGGHSPALWMGIVCGILFIAVRFWQTQGALISFASPIALGLIVFAFFIAHCFRNVEVVGNLAISVFGILYVSVPMSLLLDVMYVFGAKGWWWFFLVVGVTVLADMGGYFFGKAFGRHKMVPRLSPNKTIEGAIGGLLLGVAGAMLWYLAAPDQVIFWQLVILGAVLAIVGQVGDVVESLLKRDVGIKDSNCLPGLGGLLDTLDSLLLNGPVIYLFLRLFGASA